MGSLNIIKLITFLMLINVITSQKNNSKSNFDNNLRRLNQSFSPFEFFNIFNNQKCNNSSENTHTHTHNNIIIGSNFVSLFSERLINWIIKEGNMNRIFAIQNLPGFTFINDVKFGASQITDTFISTVTEIVPGLYKVSGSNGENKFITFGAINNSENDWKILEITGPAGTTHIVNEGPREFNSEIYSNSIIENLDEFLHTNSFPKMGHVCEEIKNWFNTLNENDTEKTNFTHTIIYKLCYEESLTNNEIDKIDDFMKTKNGKLSDILQIPQNALNFNQTLNYLTFPPTNMKIKSNFSSQGAWPVPHANAYCNAASTNYAPNSDKPLELETLYSPQDISTSIFLFYSNNNKYLWGTSWFEVFKIDNSGSKMNIIDKTNSGNFDELLDDIYHGAYSVLTIEENFIVPRATKLYIFHDVEGTGGQKIMRSEFVYSVQNDLPNSPPQYFVAVSIVGNGDIVWATQAGMVGINSRFPNENFTHSLAIMDLNKNDENLTISNAICADLEGGIYIVTSTYLHKLNWDGTSLTEVWKTEYALGIDVGAVRLGQGSGSTPTLMGPPDNQYVVITDDSTVMNVLAFNAQNGEFVASHPITFGNPNTTSSISEQSLLVSGWRIGVVNNAPTDDAFSEIIKSTVTSGLESLLSAFAPPNLEDEANILINTINSLWPVIVGDAPKGVEQIQFDPYTHTFTTTWFNNVSIPNGIPTMSTNSELMYGIGKRGFMGMEAAPFRGMWTLEAIDWWNGDERYYFNIGMGPYSNSFYAATQVGDNEVIGGVIGGIVKVYEKKQSNNFFPFFQFPSFMFPW